MQRDCVEVLEPVISWSIHRASIVYIYLMEHEGKYLEKYLNTLQKYLNTVIKYKLKNVFKYSD